MNSSNHNVANLCSRKTKLSSIKPLERGGRESPVAGIAEGSVSYEEVFTKLSSDFTDSIDYASIFNWYINRYMPPKISWKIEQLRSGKQYAWQCSLEVFSFGGRLTAFRTGDSSKYVRMYCMYEVLVALKASKAQEFNQQQLLIPKTQMQSVQLPTVQVGEQTVNSEKTGTAGDATQLSEQETSTIVTADQAITEQLPKDPPQTASEECSSEPIVRVPQLTKRWMPLSQFQLGISAPVSTVHRVSLPVTAFNQSACAPNVLLYRNYIYSRNNFKIRVVVNANKFHCGKLVVSALHNPYGLVGNNFLTTNSVLYRPHAIIDLTANNSVDLEVPFRFHRTFVRNTFGTTANAGVQAAWNADVLLTVLSPLRTGPGGAQSVDVRIFYEMSESEFAAISYQVVPETQMLKALDMSQQLIKTLEKVDIGPMTKLLNFDKPSMTGATPVVLRPRVGFCNGKGFVDVARLGNDPMKVTPFRAQHVYAGEPQTAIELARIWGRHQTFTWAASAVADTVLMDLPINPDIASPNFIVNYANQPTPLTRACALFNYWRGSIEMRFDFVSNAFHTGTVLISIEFNRPAAVGDSCGSFSCYTKTFHLGEQKSVSIVVPYIYDTPFRRRNLPPFSPLAGAGVAASDNIRDNSLHIIPSVHTNVKVRVVNVLRPVASVTQDIQVLVWWRAGENFQLSSLCQSGYMNTFEIIGGNIFPPITQFPLQRGTIGSGNQLTPITQMSDAMCRYCLAGPVSCWTCWSCEGCCRCGAKAGKIPRTQMDEGVITNDVNNPDTTENFSTSKYSRAHVSDDETHFKDILRRPVLLFDRRQVNGWVNDTVFGKSAFAIPIKPPCSMFSSRKFNQTNVPSLAQPFYSGLSSTPQNNILSLFKHWRGSMRYTIVAHSSSGPPIYVSRIPKSGVLRFGNIDTGVGAEEAATDALKTYGSGCPVEILVPSVNPTLVVETPFDSETDFLEMNGVRTGIIKWRDQGDYAGGHLMITCAEDVFIDVWWSAGDDFHMTNFLGGSTLFTNLWNYSYNDNTNDTSMSRYPVYNSPRYKYVEGQQPENHEPVVVRQAQIPKTQMMSNFKQMVESAKTMAPRVAIACVPIVGPAAAAAPTLIKVENTLDSVKQLSEKFGVSLDAMKNLMEPLVNKLEGMYSGLTNANQVGRAAFNLLIDILAAVVSKSWYVVALSIIRTIGNYFSYQLDEKILELASSFASGLATLLGISSQADSEFTVWSLCGTLCAIVGTIVGVKVDPRNVNTTWWQGLVIRLTQTSGLTYFTHVINIFSSVFKGIFDYICYALGYVNPETEALVLLKGKKHCLASFVSESNLLMSEYNNGCKNLPGFKTRYWKNVMQALQIQRILTTMPPNLVSPIVAKVCSDMIKHSNEQSGIMKGFPVKWEPFVLCVTGDTGIGKSYIVEYLAKHMMKKIKYSKQVPSLVYYLNNGNDYWSGFEDQPVICFDEWLNTNDPNLINKVITTMFDLKSKKVFIPPQAELERKRDTVNSFAVITCTNNAFPTNLIKTVMEQPEIIYRRRDLVVKAVLKDEYVGMNLRDLDHNITDDFDHLEFQVYDNVLDENSLIQERLSTSEFMELLLTKFEKYSKQEKRNVLLRIRELQDMFSTTDARDLNIQDPFSLFYLAQERLVQVGENHLSSMLPVEVLNVEVEKLIKHFDSQRAEIGQGAMLPEIDIPVAQSFLSDLFSKLFGVAIGMTSWSLERASKWLRAKAATDVNRDVECCICREMRSSISRMCASSVAAYQANGNIEVLHSVCSSCWRSLVAIGDPSRCPMCRCTDMCATIPFALHMQVNFWIAQRDKIQLNLADFLEKASDILKHPLGVVTTDLLFRMFEFYRSETHEEASQVVKNQSISLILGHAVHQFRHYYANSELGVIDFPLIARVQSPDDEISFEDDEEDLRDPFDELFKPETNLHNIAASYDEPREHRVCPHRSLMKYPGTCRYLDGNWMFPKGNHGMLTFSDVKCVECAWDDEALIHQFYKDYMLLQKTLIQQELVKWYNGNPSKIIPKRIVAYSLVRMLETIPDITEDNWMTFISSQFKPIIDFIIQWRGVLLLCGLLYGLYRFVGVDSVAPEVQTFKDPRTMTRHFRLGKTPVATTITSARAQITDEHKNAINTIISNNYVRIETTGKIKRVMTGLGICNHWVCVPKHYLATLRDKESVITFCSLAAGVVLNRVVYVPDPGNDIVSETADIALIKAPPQFKMFKNIIPYFGKLDSYLSGFPNKVSILEHHNGDRAPQEIPLTLLGYEPAIQYNHEDVLIVANDVLRYNYSRNGACGAVVLNPDSTTPIMGVHFSGIGKGLEGVGFASLMSQETFADVMADTQAFSYEEPTEVLKVPFEMEEDCQIEYISGISPTKGCHIPTKTKLMPSVISNVVPFPNTKEPCILSPSDPRHTEAKLTLSPLRHGIKKHGILTGTFDPNALGIVAEAIRHEVLSYPPASKKKFSWEEACVGIVGDDSYAPIDFVSSPGYPYNLKYKTKGDLVKIVRNEALQVVKVELTDELKQELERKSTLRKHNQIPLTIFADVLKDEKRPIAKVRSEGGTRIFCNAPMDFVVELRSQFLHYFASQIKNRIENNFAVGISPDGPEWGLVVRKLCSKGKNFINLDYSNFGPGYNCGVGIKAWNIMCDYVLAHDVARDPQQLEAMKFELSHSAHVASRLLYRQFCGSPSGSPDTTPKNCLVNKLYLTYIWYVLYKRQSNKAYWYDEFQKHVYLLYYGDDLIGSVSDEVKDWFNMRTICDEFARLDVKVTIPQQGKASVSSAFIDLKELQFLKRKFAPHPKFSNEWLAPIEVDSVYSSVHWIWKCNDRKAATVENCKSALELAYGHGPEFFENFKYQLNLACIKSGIKAFPITWDDLDEMFFPTYYK